MPPMSVFKVASLILLAAWNGPWKAYRKGDTSVRNTAMRSREGEAISVWLGAALREKVLDLAEIVACHLRLTIGLLAREDLGRIAKALSCLFKPRGVRFEFGERIERHATCELESCPLKRRPLAGEYLRGSLE